MPGILRRVLEAEASTVLEAQALDTSINKRQTLTGPVPARLLFASYSVRAGRVVTLAAA